MIISVPREVSNSINDDVEDRPVNGVASPNYYGSLGATTISIPTASFTNNTPIPSRTISISHFVDLDSHQSVQAFAHRHRPIFYLHEDEEYFPCSVDYYLQNCELFCGNRCIKRKPIDPQQLGDHQWLEQQCRMACDSYDDHRCRFNLRLDKNSRNGFENNIQNAPLYARVRITRNHYIDITYVLHCAYNGPYRVFCFNVGEHDADFEHITVRISSVTDCIIGIFCGAHGYLDGQWSFPEDSDHRGPTFEIEPMGELTPTSRPVLYIARYSHAVYPRPTFYLRIFGCANDVTGMHHRWDPLCVILGHTPTPVPPESPSFTASTPDTLLSGHHISSSGNLHSDGLTPSSYSSTFMTYPGCFACDGIDNIPSQHWFKHGDPDTSTVWWRRLFCSFMPAICGCKLKTLGLKLHQW